MKLSSFSSVASAGVLAALVACGDISDPTRDGERVATVSGALTGVQVTAGTHVAIVWRVATTNTWEVGSDVPVVNGRFAINLAPPADSRFSPAEGGCGLGANNQASVPAGGWNAGNESGSPSQPGSPAGANGSGAKDFGLQSQLSPRDSLSGQITRPLEVAVAGFVVYVDGNGNGHLDLEGSYLSSPDKIIGGSHELLLTYFRGGGTLDYEKLRDRSGILPHAGYNLGWSEGRWLPLDAVELKLSTSVKLPSTVCGGCGVAAISDPEPTQVAPPTPVGASTSQPGQPGEVVYRYPNPSDPNLKCSPDGTSFTYDPPCTPPPPPPPPPTGLCASEDGSGVGTDTCEPGRAEALKPNAPIPDGWPCPVAKPPPPPADAGK